ncbi:hypothetical protein [Butyrivibrio hungatei]|uniref:Uncharacterized protein n=1 Tax=Butyrivibrio hungatei TaxID=185008 RepID=A0A1D9P701_9FIRM|nr:hypothetical protein [Butyrivibrio hungatei]AOZ97915.1 hypothetical protein bhn_II116 [Butyrivibrio hungatei]
MDKLEFINVLKDNGYAVDPSASIPTIFASKSELKTIIRDIHRLMKENDYNESFKVDMHTLKDVPGDIEDSHPEMTENIPQNGFTIEADTTTTLAQDDIDESPNNERELISVGAVEGDFFTPWTTNF